MTVLDQAVRQPRDLRVELVALTNRLAELAAVVGVVEAVQCGRDLLGLRAQLRERAPQTGAGLAVRRVIRDDDVALDLGLLDLQKRNASMRGSPGAVVVGDVERARTASSKREAVKSCSAMRA